MKKLAMCLVVLTMAIPAMAADVDFAFTDNGDGTGVLSWTINKPDTEIVGMGLNVDSVDGGVVDGVAVDSFFDVFIDAAYSDPTLYDGAASPAQAGTPVALQTVAGETTLPNTQFCISVGHLEGTTDGAGIVLTSVDGITFAVAENTTRGGVVDQNGDALTTNLDTLGDLTITVGGGDPECWSYPCFGKGDANGDGQVSATDIQILLAGWNEYTECADFNTDGQVSATDIQLLLDGWNNGCPE